jgi:hypothetical protein
MAIRVPCPRCGTRHRLQSPYPVPGAEIHCPCGQLLAVSYPSGLVEQIRASGGCFEDETAPPDTQDEPVSASGPPALFSEFSYRSKSARQDISSDPRAEVEARPCVTQDPDGDDREEASENRSVLRKPWWRMLIGGCLSLLVAHGVLPV